MRAWKRASLNAASLLGAASVICWFRWLSSLHCNASLRFIDRPALSFGCHGTPKADVRHACVRRAAHAGARSVVKAVADAAEERSAALHALRWPLPRVEAMLRTSRVDRQRSA